MNNYTARASSGHVSYYDMTLARILDRLDESGMARMTIAAGAGISTDTLDRKLNGESLLMVEDIRRISATLGCRMSDLVV